VTAHPTAAWTRQQLRQALGFDTHYGYLLHDRDSIFSRELDAAVGGLGLRILKTPPRCPMANGLCERVIGTTLRRPDQPRRRSLAITSGTSAQYVANWCSGGCITSIRCALPELGAIFADYRWKGLVGADGLEPPTFAL